MTAEQIAALRAAASVPSVVMAVNPKTILALLDEHAALLRVAEAGLCSKAIADITAERLRQIEVEGWTPEHDDAGTDCELIDAASCYLAAALGAETRAREYDAAPVGWPWSLAQWKPKDSRRNLVRAGALCMADQALWRRKYPESPPQELPRQMLEQIVSEIERLDRAALAALLVAQEATPDAR